METMAAISDFLLKQTLAGKETVLIVDEAQNLTEDLLEQVRLISNIETDDRKLLQIVLMGQPELRDRLNSHQLRQLRQRITVRYHLNPLTPDRSGTVYSASAGDGGIQGRAHLQPARPFGGCSRIARAFPPGQRRLRQGAAGRLCGTQLSDQLLHGGPRHPRTGRKHSAHESDQRRTKRSAQRAPGQVYPGRCPRRPPLTRPPGYWDGSCPVWRWRLFGSDLFHWVGDGESSFQPPYPILTNCCQPTRKTDGGCPAAGNGFATNGSGRRRRAARVSGIRASVFAATRHAPPAASQIARHLLFSFRTVRHHRRQVCKVGRLDPWLHGQGHCPVRSHLIGPDQKEVQLNFGN